MELALAKGHYVRKLRRTHDFEKLSRPLSRRVPPHQPCNAGPVSAPPAANPGALGGALGVRLVAFCDSLELDFSRLRGEALLFAYRPLVVEYLAHPDQLFRG